MKPYPERVRIVEVGPRDGLQNESSAVDVADKSRLVEKLAECGISVIETGSFVSPKWVPQMANSAAVFDSLSRQQGVRYTALTPNLKGFEAALEAGADEVAIFAAASESFSRKNINCSIAESLERFSPLMQAARDAGMPVRGYISCVVACPYEGQIAPAAVREISEELLTMGCYEISLGDTIGAATAGDIQRLLDTLLPRIDRSLLAMHCHDTYGQALTNIYAALEYGISTIDSSVAGLGGCPYAAGASGNVATEDVVYMLEGLGVSTGIDLERLVATGNWISQVLNRTNQSRVGNARRTHTPTD